MSDDDDELLPMPRHSLYYVLDARNRVRATRDMIKWALFFRQIDNRRVALTPLTNGGHLSTVFLGLDHRFSGKGPPIVFETMLFPESDVIARTSTWAQATLAHMHWCEEHADLVVMEPAL
jgi:hypothetical protein